MAYQVSRTDTGQFVLMDSVTDTVVINDDIALGFIALEQAVASKPSLAPASANPTTQPSSGDAAIQGSTTFQFRGGPRYTPILLAVVLPFAWLAVLYFALANLLSETALNQGANAETEAKLEQLEREIQTLRSQIAGAPRTEKSKPPRPKSKPTDDDKDEDEDDEDTDGPDEAPKSERQPTKPTGSEVPVPEPTPPK